VTRAHEELEEIAGSTVDLFRPPYGAHGMKSLLATRRRGMRSILWSVDTDDWKGLSPDAPLQGTTGRMAPGGIGLMHDTPARGTVEADTAEGLLPKQDLVRELVEEMKRRGLTPVSLDELTSEGEQVRRAKVSR
jgi:peptidoglycan/xylan/chitin deacetylase (PgdA/CDA1 family)